MLITPINSVRHTSFRGNNDLRDLISKAMEQASRNTNNYGEDSFTPSNSSQPIVVEKLIISTNESGEKSTKAEAAKNIAATAGVGAAGGAGVDALSDKKGLNFDEIFDSKQSELESDAPEENDTEIGDEIDDGHDSDDDDDDDGGNDD